LSKCAWSERCDQEALHDSAFCYFHWKRGLRLIDDPGLEHPSPKVLALVEALRQEAR